jgi:glucose-1-phosphate thymidylyltransferase
MELVFPMKLMHAFILAGGFATRLWPLTEKRAKPLLPLAGKPIITHLLEKIPAEIPVTVSTNAAFEEDFRRWAKEQMRADLSIRIEGTRKDDEKLGALGAVRAWILDEKIDDDVLLLTGDNYFGCSIDAFLDARGEDEPLIAAHDIGSLESAKAFGTVIVHPKSEASPSATPEGRREVLTFEEKPAQPKSTLVSTGCSWIPRACLPILIEYAALHPDNVGGIFEEFLRRRISVGCFTFTERWFDIGSFEAYLEATRALVGENVLRQDGSIVENSACQGSVVVGRESRVMDCNLRDVVLFDGCTVEDCHLENCILDEGCTLKGIDLRGKMLRAGTRLTPR